MTLASGKSMAASPTELMKSVLTSELGERNLSNTCHSQRAVRRISAHKCTLDHSQGRHDTIPCAFTKDYRNNLNHTSVRESSKCNVFASVCGMTSSLEAASSSPVMQRRPIRLLYATTCKHAQPLGQYLFTPAVKHRVSAHRLNTNQALFRHAYQARLISVHEHQNASRHAERV
jgi:hypothetical protein